jgi:hypothetical protein
LCSTLLDSILIFELVHSRPDPDGVFYSVPIGWLLAVYSSKFVASALYPFQFIASSVKAKLSYLIRRNATCKNSAVGTAPFSQVLLSVHPSPKSSRIIEVAGFPRRLDFGLSLFLSFLSTKPSSVRSKAYEVS